MKTSKTSIFTVTILALFVALLAFMTVENVTKSAWDSIVIHRNASESGEVVYRGAAIDGVWQNPWENVVSSGYWVFDSEQATYTAVDDTVLEIRLPKGSDRSLTFNAGPQAGSVMVVVNGDTLCFDLTNDQELELGIPHAIPDSEIADVSDAALFVATVAFVVTAIIVLITGVREETSQEKKREVWGDFVRAVCSFVIVFLHNSCNIFEQFVEGRVLALISNCLTAFAVPCFFMLSGSYLLRREHGITETLRRRVPKTFLPVLVWGAVYILISGDITWNSFVRLLFQNQTPHLWFMYSLFGIYMLLPLISKLYCSSSMKQKYYALLLLLVVPTAVYDISNLMGVFVPNYSFAVFWPDLGLFLLGGVLWELRDKIKSVSWVWYCMLFVVGLWITVVGTLISTEIAGEPSKTFISAMGSTGNTIMASTFICFAMTAERYLKIARINRVIHIVGQSAMGVYFIHMVFLMGLNSERISGLPLYCNSGSMTMMLISSVVYFTMCVCVCAFGRKSRALGWLF